MFHYTERRIAHHALVICLIAGVATPASAGYLANKFKYALTHVYCKINKKIFDGKAFKVKLYDAQRYYNDFSSQLQQAEGMSRSLSPRDRQDDEVKALLAQMEEKKKFLAAMKPAIERFAREQEALKKKAAAEAKAKKAAEEAREAAMKTACDAFVKKVLHPLEKANDQGLYRVAKQYKRGKELVWNAEQLGQVKSALATLSKACAEDAYKVILASEKSCWKRSGSDDPVTMCKAAAKKDAIQQQIVDNSARRTIHRVLSRWDLAIVEKKIHASRSFGWGTKYSDVTGVSDAEKADVVKQIEPLYKLAGLKVMDLEPIWADLVKKKKRIAQYIDETAGKPHRVTGGRVGYWKKHIKSAIKKFYGGGSKLMKVGGGKWEVIRRGLVPIERRLYGTLFFKPKGSKYCLAGNYRVTEKYVKRRYQRAGGVWVMGLDFHKCKGPWR